MAIEKSSNLAIGCGAIAATLYWAAGPRNLYAAVGGVACGAIGGLACDALRRRSKIETTPSILELPLHEQRNIMATPSDERDELGRAFGDLLPIHLLPEKEIQDMVIAACDISTRRALAAVSWDFRRMVYRGGGVSVVVPNSSVDKSMTEVIDQIKGMRTFPSGSVTRLDLSGCGEKRITQSHASQLVRSFPNLTELSIGAYCGTRFISRQAIPTELRMRRIDQQALVELKHLSRLRSLRVQGLTWDGNCFNLACNRLKALKELKVTGNRGDRFISNSLLSNNIDAADLQALADSSIESLEIGGGFPTGAGQHISAMPHLRILRLWTGVSDADMQAFSGVTTLEELSVNYQDGGTVAITDLGIGHFAQHPALKRLSYGARQNPEITPTGTLPLIQAGIDVLAQD